MTPLEGLAVLAAGLGAGLVNTVVGAGTLLTFPTLVALGYAPVVANVSNTVGLVAGSFSGVHGYRRELAGQRRRLVRLGAMSVLGGVGGGLLLLLLPEEAFRAVVPVLLALGSVLVALQPRIAARFARSRPAHHPGGVGLMVGVFATGVYGGYFGAAQGVLLIALLGLALDEDLQRVNAAKNLLAALVNLTAALLFVFVAEVSWPVAGLVAVGAVVGAQLGATVGRRMPARFLRGVVVVVGLAVAAWMAVRVLA